ncbi:LysM peptidoglycan-binding domain-containing protein [Streptomyces sp. NPDC001407]|uniref:LysM peptidoglycan-binding domain-containing protein n=1 Tax=Streptomyces sp. NPDC001407 TaxID=3364573 RepID=UPI0036A81287
MKTRSTAAAILRGLICLAVLVALLVLVPVLLWQVGVLPHHVPSLDEVTTALTSPDNGTLFLGAITLIGWYGYVSFAASVLLELFSALRHRSAPRIKVLGGTQRLAGTLVGGIILLLPTSAAFAATTPATAASTAVTAPQTTGTPAASATAQSATATKAATPYTGPVHEVKQGDSLWEIAEQRLGSGTRWHDIVTANEGIPQADGTVISADTAFLQPGWTLRLPSDAKPAPAPAAAESGGAHTQLAAKPADAPAAPHGSHTVKEGESLSSIAQDELGDAGAYQEIAQLNKDKQQSDGRALTDPDEIYPGWQLKLPAAHGSSDRSDAKTPSQEKPAPKPQHDGRQQDQQHDRTQTPAPDKQHDQDKNKDKGKEDGPDGTGDQTARPQTPAEQPSTPAPHTPDESPATSAPAQQAPAQKETSEGSNQSVKTAAAAGSILAAAVLAVVATRRARQQRRRRAKRRIPMPSGATADFEKQLRIASDVTGTALADRALRTLAFRCREAGRALPEVEALRITARGLELYLAAATPPVAPFTEREDNPALWWCPARGADLLTEDQAADIAPPYPALVSLGETEDGDAVLVDLETIGLLRLDGSPEEVRAVMLALAVELASSQLAPATQVVLAGAGSELQSLYPDQIDHHTDLDSATAELQAHDAFQRDALDEGSHDHLRAARLSDETAADSWIPRILISTAPPSGPAAGVLGDLLASRPRTSVAVVSATGGELELPSDWTLPARPGAPVELPGLGLAVKLQYLDDTAYERLVQLLATSSRTDDVPPPSWTRHTGPADRNGPHRAVAAPAEDASALAPETTAAPAAPTVQATAQAGDLATALPSFTSLTPSLPPAPATRAGGDAADTEEEGASALSPAVAAPSPASPPVEEVEEAGEATVEVPDPDENADTAVQETGTDQEAESASALSPAVAAQIPAPADVDTATAAPSHERDGQDPYAAEADGQDDSALGAEVWGRPESAAAFHEALGEVLAEQADEHQPDAAEDEEADSGLSSAALGQHETQPAAPAERRIVPRPSAVTSTVLAALATPPEPPAAPQVQVLGAVDIVGTLGRVESNRRNSLKEIAAWLVLHPGLSRQDLDEAIWPGIRTLADSRNSAISKLRAWVGRDPLLPASDPQAAYLPPIKGGVYAFNDQVTSDWHQFQDLYQKGMHHDGPDADIALAQALALVRGRPFADVDPSKYVWAEGDIQEMISAIVDVAHELAERRRHVRDYRAAAQAVTKGMVVDNQSELLYRDLFTICHEMGDREGLERAAHQLARINAEEGCDSSPETVGLLRTLLKGERAQPTLKSAAS